VFFILPAATDNDLLGEVSFGDAIDGWRGTPASRPLEDEADVAGAARAIGSSPAFKPKKRGPFQLVPVIVLAMVDRLE
jgi:hypothetical protein